MIHFYHFNVQENKITKICIFEPEDSERLIDYAIIKQTQGFKGYYCSEDLQENLFTIKTMEYIGHDDNQKGDEFRTDVIFEV